MTPYALEETIRRTKKQVEQGMSTPYATYLLMLALVQHEADKAALSASQSPSEPEK